MRKGVFSLLLMAMFTGQASAAVGVATVISGQVELQRSDQVFALVEGVNLNIGDIVRTGGDASAQLDMDDGSVLSLGENSEMVIGDYRLREDGSVAEAAIEMLTGWLRFAVSKLRSKDSSYRFHMPTAVLGVRGTEGVIQVEDEEGAEASRILLEEGVVDVVESDGEEGLTAKKLTLRKGQFAERLRGKRLALRLHMAASFRKRLPPHLRMKLKRRARMLRRRGVTPRMIRRATRHDMRRYMKRHDIQRRLHRLFERRKAGGKGKYKTRHEMLKKKKCAANIVDGTTDRKPF